MKGILVLIIFSISVAAIAWNVDLGFIERALPPLSRFRISNPVPLAPSAASVAQSKANLKKRGASHPQAEPAEPVEAPVPETTAAISIATVSPAAVPWKPILKPAPADPFASVSIDGGALYSSNSHSGRVVTVLKKGEVVEPEFRINDQGMEWTFVNVADQTVSGFLPNGVLHQADKRPVEKTAP